MKQLREKLQKFMIGRYGVDPLNRFIMWAVIVLIFLNLFLRWDVLFFLEIIGLVWCYFRMFSKNYPAREKENRVYMRVRLKVTDFLNKWKFRFQQARQYHIYKCPGCGQKIRIPRGKRRVSIHCPKCGTDFIKKS